MKSSVEICEFGTRYAELAAVIKDASMYGPSPSLEDRYTLVRAWMMSNYPGIKSQFQAHLPTTEPRSALEWSGESRDAFEKLFVAPTLDSLIRASERHLDRRLFDTHTALSACGISLGLVVH